MRPLMNGSDGVALYVKALQFAGERHAGQWRKGKRRVPYIQHPIQLTEVLLLEAGVDDPAVLCAALLHDVIEDTPTQPAEMHREFGAEITGIVLEVTDDKGLGKQVRKQRQIERVPSLGHKARLVKLADKINNLRDIAGRAPPGWPLRRQVDYFDWAAAVIHGLRGTSPLLEAAFDRELSRRPSLAHPDKGGFQ